MLHQDVYEQEAGPQDSDGPCEADEATLKSSRCLIELEDFKEAKGRLMTLLNRPLAPMAYVGLSELLERSGGPPSAEIKLLKRGLSEKYGPDAEGLDRLASRVSTRLSSLKDPKMLSEFQELLASLNRTSAE
jgi:hypothetical protein